LAQLSNQVCKNLLPFIFAAKKRTASAAALSQANKLEAENQTGRNPHVVLIGESRKTGHHPVELDHAESQSVRIASQIQTATGHHVEAIRADPCGRGPAAA